MRVVVTRHGVEFDAVSGAQGKADTEALICEVVVVLARKERPDILGVTVAPSELAGDAQQHPVRHDRDIECALDPAIVVLAILRADIAFEPVLRFHRFEQDVAAGRILAEQRTLRTREYLDVGKIVVAADAPIDVHRVRHFGEVVDHARGRAEGGALATQREERELARVAAVDREQRRGVVGQRGAVGDRLLLQGALIEGGHRERHFLQALFAATRGDDNVAKAAVGFVRGRRGIRCLRERHAREGAGADRKRDEELGAHRVHISLPRGLSFATERLIAPE
jgi:hypothetical protein